MAARQSHGLAIPMVGDDVAQRLEVRRSAAAPEHGSGSAPE
jgi:hypothetical protein